MATFYVDENNSGGYTVALGVLSDPRPHWVSIEADSADEAIHKFERHFGLDWNDQNSYEGNSCNCCGRRFSLHAPRGLVDSKYDEYGTVSEYDEQPYFVESGRGGCALADAPKKGKRHGD